MLCFKIHITSLSAKPAVKANSIYNSTFSHLRKNKNSTISAAHQSAYQTLGHLVGTLMSWTYTSIKLSQQLEKSLI